MAEFSFQFDVKPVVERLESLTAGLTDRSKMHELLVIRLQQRVFRAWGKGWPALSEFTFLTRTGQVPLSDKGLLKQSLVGQNPSAVSTAPGTLNKVEPFASTIGTNVRYAAMQNFGMDPLLPVRGKFLALPMTREAKAKGSPLKFGRPLALSLIKATREYFLVEGREVIVSRGKNKGQKRVRPVETPEGEYPDAHYILKRSVVIPARRFMPTEAEAAEDAQKVGAWWLGQLAKGQALSGGPQ